MEELEYAYQFKELLENSLKKLYRPDLAIAFSGGLDSSVMAKMMLNLGFKFKAYVVGVKGCKDIVQAKKVSKEIGLNLEVIELTEAEIEKAIPMQRDILLELYNKQPAKELDVNAIPISYNLPLYFVAKYSKETNIFLSQGPDEMLGGYTRHLKLEKTQALKEMENNLQDFLNYGLKQNILTGEHFSKNFIMPYLDEKIIDFCLKLPYELKIKDGIRKHILRTLALEIGLSHETAFKPKRAAQYGSGIIYTMKSLAKKRKVHISRYIREC